MVRTYTVIGFGIIVPEEVFGQKFPEIYTVGEFGDRVVNSDVVKKLRTNLIEVRHQGNTGEFFIVSSDYVYLAEDVTAKIPYQQIVRNGQALIPWFQTHFPGYEPDLYAFTDYIW